MKKLLFCIMFISYLLLSAPVVYAAERQDQDAALKSFNQIANKYTDFFQKAPMLLSKVSPPDNPRTQAYYMTYFTLDKTFFDIVKTNSIVTPYSAYIAVSTDVFDNTLCGNVSFNKKQKNGWATVDAPIRQSEDRACFMARTDVSGPIQHRFNFLYQTITRKWVLINITYQNGESNDRFMAVLGVASPTFSVMTEDQALKFNKPWGDLFKNP